MKIRTKLLLALASISLLPPIAAYVAVISNPRISFALRMNEYEAEQGNLAQCLQSDIRGIRSALEESLSETYRIQVEPSQRADAERQRQNANNAVRAGVEAFARDLDGIVRSTSEQSQAMVRNHEVTNASEHRETELVAKISDFLPHLKADAGKFVSLSDNSRVEKEGESVQTVLEPEIQKNLERIQELATETDQEAAEDRRNIESAIRSSNEQAFLIALAALGVSVLVALLLSRLIITPIRSLRTAAQAIGQGKLETRIAARSEDEFGDVASGFNFMADSLCRLMEQKNLTQKELSQTNEKLRDSVRELETRNRDAGILSVTADLLQSCFTLQEAAAVIGSSAEKLFPAYSGALHIFSSSRNVLEAVATWGPSVWTERLFGPNDCWALRRGRAHHCQSQKDATRCPHLSDGSGSSSLCTPLTAHGETLGVLCLMRNSSTPEGPMIPISDSDARLATSLAEETALSFANLKLREKLRYQSVRDPLTGLFNRRYLDETLERELPNAVRRNRNLGLIMIDVDHFKKFNDIHGHDAGDAVLRELGDFLTKSIRRGDVACRYGGEEFVLVLVESSMEDTVRRAEELRIAFQHLSIKHRDVVLGKVTISAGVAALPNHGTTAADLLAAADAALLHAKEHGRDRVLIAEAAASRSS